MLKARRRAAAAVIFVVLACISGPSAAIAAQDTLTVTVGERVRVRTLSGATHDGVVGAVSSSTLELRVAGEPVVSLPLTSIEKLEAQRGQRRSRGKGAVRGLLIGVGAGAALGALVGPGCCTTRGDHALVGAIGLGVLGLGIGVAIGRTTDRWEEVPLERLRVSLEAQRDGRFALGFSVRF